MNEELELRALREKYQQLEALLDQITKERDALQTEVERLRKDFKEEIITTEYELSQHD